SADPVGGRPGDPQSWNRYAYVRNDPVNMTDPSGQSFLGFLQRLFQAVAAFFGAQPEDTMLGTPAQFPTDSDSDTAALMGSIYNPQSLSQYGISNFTSDPNPLDRFGPCVKSYSDQLGNLKNLSRPGYNAAKAAAADANIQTAQVLGIWNIENSLSDTFVTKGAGDVGPMQVTPPAAKDLDLKNQLPADYKTDLNANMLAGARYYALNVNVHHAPANQAAAAYHRSTHNHAYLDDKGQHYQQAFNKLQPLFSAFVDCV